MHPNVKPLVLAITILFFAILLLGGFWLLSPVEERTPIQVISPDGRFKAWVEVVRPVWNYDTYVRVQDLSGAERSTNDTVKIILKAESWIDVNLVWQDEKTLIIEYEDRKVYAKHEDPWHGVAFVFRKIQ